MEYTEVGGLKFDWTKEQKFNENFDNYENKSSTFILTSRLGWMALLAETVKSYIEWSILLWTVDQLTCHPAKLNSELECLNETKSTKWFECTNQAIIEELDGTVCIGPEGI